MTKLGQETGRSHHNSNVQIQLGVSSFGSALVSLHSTVLV